jgi:acyl-coenzyme A synthetase/AMP-(fatty) acid ligase
MSSYIPLNELLLRCDPSTIVTYRENRVIDWHEFRCQIVATAQKLEQGPNWVLVCDDTYWFAVGFFALLHAGKKIILPVNGLSQTIAELPGPISGLLIDREQISDLSSVHLPSISTQVQKPVGVDFVALKTDQACIELFTSGSTGRPQKVTKNIANLSAEVDSLETLWGELLNNTVTLATVSHQHIYGLLFRLLWPLCAGRAFVGFHFEYPEALLAYIQKLNEQNVNSVLISSPAHLKRMTQLIDSAELSPGTKKIFSSGGPLSRETALQFEQQFGQAPMEVFGSTETGGVAYRQQTSDVALQSWQLFDLVDIQCRKTDNALLVKSPYMNTDEWFAMGDKIELLDGRRFVSQGRVDRIVKIEEKRLSLSEMEQRLEKMDWVEDAKLLVISGEREQVACVVVLSQQGKALLAEDGRRAMGQQLRNLLSVHYERVVLPRKWRYVDDLPHNQQGKTTQQDLADLFLKEFVL